MKALLINGSPRAKGCTYTALTELMRTLESEGIEAELLHVGHQDIESTNGKPILVAYWFQHDLQRIKKRFDVRELKTSKDIADWDSGKIPVAVIHPASVGHGLNLSAGQCG